MKNKFKHVALGGTFDRLHEGHKSFIREGFVKGDRVTIGVSSDEFVKQRLKAKVQDFDKRLEELKKFLELENLLGKAAFLKLNDVFGSAIDDKSIDSVIVTKDSLAGAKQINDQRKKLGLRPLKVIRSRLIAGEKRRVISSTNVRSGLTNRKGLDHFSTVGVNKHVLPDNFRTRISSPQGKVIQEKDLLNYDLDSFTKVILVGDVVTKTFIKLNLIFDFAVVDLRTNKRKLFKSLESLGIREPSRVITVRNKRGTISTSMSRAIRNFLKSNLKRAVIRVIGEEDLAVIPSVILAPLGSVIFYGQRGQGIVVVRVEEDTKEKFLDILSYFQKA